MRISVFLGCAVFILNAAAALAKDGWRIVPDTTYHAGEADDVKNGEKWIAIMFEGKSFKAVDAIVSVTKVEDVLADDPAGGPYTGVQVSGQERALFYIKKPGLKAADIVSYATPQTTLESDTLLTVKDGKAPLTFMAKTVPVKVEGEKQTQPGYQLSARIEGRETLIVQPGVSQDKTPQLLWTGDVNGDGYVDFVMDTSLHYNTANTVLFVSHADQKGVTYTKVAERKAMGC